MNLGYRFRASETLFKEASRPLRLGATAEKQLGNGCAVQQGNAEHTASAIHTPMIVSMAFERWPTSTLQSRALTCSSARYEGAGINRGQGQIGHGGLKGTVRSTVFELAVAL